MKVSPDVILDELRIAPGDVLFVKASMDRLEYGGPETVTLLEAILERLGPGGTIVMPSFPYPNEAGRAPDGFVFDVTRTPSQMGLLSEVLRRQEGTCRSEQFWVPAVANGQDAAFLTSGQLDVRNPFGPGSTYHRLTELPTRMVGLGVSLNYNIVAHVADTYLHERYPFRLFSTEPLTGTLIDARGSRHVQHTTVVSQGRRLRMRPSRLVAASPLVSAGLRFFDHAGAFIWALPARAYFDESLRLGREALDAGRLPPWLEEMQ